MRARCITLGIVSLLVAGAALGAGEELDPHAFRSVSAQNVALQGDAVTGVVANTSARAVRDVQLQIAYTWLWKDERHPGKDSPGRTDLYTLPGEIPAGGSKPFSYRPQSPLPNRTDGHFEPAATVVGYTEIVPAQ